MPKLLLERVNTIRSAHHRGPDQMETGGNLAGAGAAGGVIRARFKLAGQVRAITAEPPLGCDPRTAADRGRDCDHDPQSRVPETAVHRTSGHPDAGDSPGLRFLGFPDPRIIEVEA
jgi:hypothetical protein